MTLSLDIICVYLILFCQNYLFKTSPSRFRDDPADIKGLVSVSICRDE
jgi:hypothetical protein